jgi:lipopolysaccharide transport protein LptA
VSFSEVVYRSFKDGKEIFVVRAGAKVGEDQAGLRLHKVEVTFPSTVRGRSGTTTIVSDECLYDPSRERATFRGRVRVTAPDGFELSTESLVYEAGPRLAETNDPVQFRREQLDGSATGAVYHSQLSQVELRADVRARITSEKGPPAEISADHATLAPDEHQVRLAGRVAARQGTDSLSAGRLTLHLDDSLSRVFRAVAVDDVELRASGGESELPAGAGVRGGRGPRRLRCRNLEMWFREDGSLLGATARPDAELEMTPGPGEARERRTLKARRLDFGFDGEGRLERLEGRTDVSYVSAPLEGGVSRSMRCQSLVGVVDPATGSAQTITFEERVELAEGRRKAAAGKAVYEEARGVLLLTGDPRLLDEEQGSDLRADEIDLGTRSGDVSGRGDVRHQIRRRGGKSGLLAREAPVLLLARRLDYSAAARTARYQEGAVLRSDRDEVRAPLIVLEEPAAGARRLTASGGVVSVLNPRPSSPERKPPAPVEIRGADMVYEEASNQAVYTGEVGMRQGDIVTRSPRATIQLTADGGQIESVVAGEPVEVRQGERRANGTRGTYAPGTETMVLVGDKVSVVEPDGEVEGRSITFHVGADRVLVDGREVMRPESVFRRKAPRP